MGGGLILVVAFAVYLVVRVVTDRKHRRERQARLENAGIAHALPGWWRWGLPVASAVLLLALLLPMLWGPSWLFGAVLLVVTLGLVGVAARMMFRSSRQREPMFLLGLGFDALPALAVIRVTSAAGRDTHTKIANGVGRIGADVVRVIDGSRCPTREALMAEWSSALQFPIAPLTWEAFANGLREWTPPGAQVLVLELDAHEALRDSTDHEREAFWHTLEAARVSSEGHVRFLFHVPLDAVRVPRTLSVLPEVRI